MQSNHRDILKYRLLALSATVFYIVSMVVAFWTMSTSAVEVFGAENADVMKVLANLVALISTSFFLLFICSDDRRRHVSSTSILENWRRRKE